MVGLKCSICGHLEKYNLKYHLEEAHKLTTKQYKKLYPGSRTMTGHSKRTIEYWVYRGYSLEEASRRVKNFQSSSKKIFIQKKIDSGSTPVQAQELWNEKQAKNSLRSIKYYLSKGYSESDALKEVQKVQASYSKLSPKFSGHKHTLESKRKISCSMKRHAKNVGPKVMADRFRDSLDSIRSKIEVKCYLELKEYFPNLIANHKIGPYIVDMFLDGIVIEFNGDFWHRNPKLYEENFTMYGKTSKEVWEKDEHRKRSILNNVDYFFTIWESDWKEEKQKIINTLEKLYESKSREKTSKS